LSLIKLILEEIKKKGLVQELQVLKRVIQRKELQNSLLEKQSSILENNSKILDFEISLAESISRVQEFRFKFEHEELRYQLFYLKWSFIIL